MPASRVFYTGKLAVGPHRVQVRTANRAGVTTIRYSWQVVPMPAPAACRSCGGGCWYPPHLDSKGQPMRWDWQIGRVTPLQRTGAAAVDIYDIDGFLTTRAEVTAIKTTWQAATLPHPRTVCYLDLAWENYRPDATPAAGTSPRARSASSTSGSRRSAGSTSGSSTRSSRCCANGSACARPRGSTRSNSTTSTASTRRPRPAST